MIRFKVTHGSNPATYHFWNGVTPVHDTPDGFGALVAVAVPIQEVTESQFELITNFANAQFVEDEQDRRLIPDA
jgi:hypothetical protein